MAARLFPLTGAECALLKLSGLANGIRAAFGQSGAGAPRAERRSETRFDFLGRKIIIRKPRVLGIMHLRNLSRGGA